MTIENSPTGLLSRLSRRYKQWNALQSPRRLKVFYTVGTIGAVLYGAAAIWVGNHANTFNPEQKKECAISAIIVGLGFLFLLPMICLKWRSSDVGGRKVPPVRLFCWWVLTVYLSLFAGSASVHAQGVTAAGSVVVSSAPTAQPQFVSPQAGPAVVFFMLFLCTLVFGFLFWVLYKIGWLGKGGGHPPQHHQDPDDGVRPQALTTSTNEQVTTFYLSGGIIVSNNAGLPCNALPSFLNVPNGAAIDSTQGGLPIGLWQMTNSVADADLDPAWPYTIIANFSILTSTNAATWTEYCTVVEYINQDPAGPLVCSVSYTNGVPQTTNWAKIHMDANSQPTSIVVYGPLSSAATATTTTTGSKGAKPQGAPAVPLPPLPPGHGDGGDTNTAYAPLPSDPHYFKLACNTNAIATSWP